MSGYLRSRRSPQANCPGVGKTQTALRRQISFLFSTLMCLLAGISAIPSWGSPVTEYRPLYSVTDTPSTQNAVVYLYSPDGPQQVLGATIQEGAVYDSYGNFLGTLNPADSQIYDSNNNAIGYVFSPA
jgi:hypothetical protein